MPPVRPNIAALQGYVPGEQPLGQEFIKLNTNENPYPCTPAVKAAIGRALQMGLQRYPDPLAGAFRERAAELLVDDAPGISPEWILCGNGSDDLLTIITRTFAGEGDLIRYPRPSYVLYETLAGIQGATVEAVDFQPDWSLGDDFTEPADRLKLAFLPNPNSPSGTLIPPADVARLAAALPCPLVVDEAYVDFAETNCLSLVAENENVLVTRTLSKSYALAGLRFGYVVAQPAVIQQLAKVKDSYNCDTLSIAGAVAAIDDRAWFDRTRAAVIATRARLTTALRGMGFACVDSQANFVWSKHAAASCRDLYARLKGEGILVRYMSYEDWGEGLRISVGTDEQIDLLIAKLADILKSV